LIFRIRDISPPLKLSGHSADRPIHRQSLFSHNRRPKFAHPAFLPITSREFNPKPFPTAAPLFCALSPTVYVQCSTSPRHATSVARLPTTEDLTRETAELFANAGLLSQIKGPHKQLVDNITVDLLNDLDRLKVMTAIDQSVLTEKSQLPERQFFASQSSISIINAATFADFTRSMNLNLIDSSR
jgi:hypothetical protein